MLEENMSSIGCADEECSSVGLWLKTLAPIRSLRGDQGSTFWGLELRSLFRPCLDFWSIQIYLN